MVALTAEARDTIQSKLDAAVASKKAPALIYGATTAEGEVIWAQSGPQDVGDPDGASITPDSVLWVCSQTKMLAAIAAFQVIETGKITLDTRVADILPELANPVVVDDPNSENPSYKPASSPMLVRHLFNHSSGLFYADSPLNNKINIGRPYGSPHDPKDPIGSFWKLVQGDYPGVPLQCEPGASFAYGYSNDALGFIVERVTGISLEEHLKKYVFGPAGMTSTSFYLTPELKERLVKLTYRGSDGELLCYADQFSLMEHDPSKVHLHLGGTALFSTPRDYLSLQRHLLQILAGTASNPILKKETLQLFFEPSLSPEGEKQMDLMFQSPGHQFGLGLGVETKDQGPGKRKAGSGYWGGWAGTMHYIDPKSGVAVYGGTQIAPPPQIPVLLTWDELQPVLYNGLGIN